MFEFAGFAYRNTQFVTHNARRAWATSKAMKKYRRGHPACAWCGRKKRLQVHHIYPVSVNPEWAADALNMITLCAKRCHITLGHSGNYARRYVANVSAVCAAAHVTRVRPYEKPNLP